MPANPDDPQPRRSLARWLLRGCLTGAALALGAQAAYALLLWNFRAVIPGRVYRCAQPDGFALDWYVRHHGVRTVVNLNGCCDPKREYLDECRATHNLNVSQEDIGMSAGRLPAVPALRRLLEVFDHAEPPLLIHCHRGIDRTGLASALALLLYTDATLDEARGQLCFFRGHLAFGRTGNMDRFFDLYEEWLAGQGRPHSPAALRRFIERDYCPGECRCRLELLGAERPLRLTRGRPATVLVRCTNTSVKPWHFQPFSTAGIHVLYEVHTKRGESVGDLRRAGLLRATVPPGGHIDLTLALPPLPAPGRYELRVDMADEQNGSFLQAGSEPLLWEVEVP
ncbi:MAG TPA: tyrosine-protein phosphatase [Gemmataceae bacterium]|nr:tyrosine-protein phosphatase [Gemmataceae bacterium]